jgi:hypothetical protein
VRPARASDSRIESDQPLDGLVARSIDGSSIAIARGSPAASSS